MPKFRVHLYPIYRTAVEVEAASPQEAHDRAWKESVFPQTVQGGGEVLYYADDDDGAVVDELNEQGDVIADTAYDETGKPLV